MTIEIKQGATFRARMTLDPGLKGWAFTSEARIFGRNKKVADLSCREIDVDGACIVEIEAPTADWPHALLVVDIKAEQGGEIVVSYTIPVNVLQEVTDG